MSLVLQEKPCCLPEVGNSCPLLSLKWQNFMDVNGTQLGGQVTGKSLLFLSVQSIFSLVGGKEEETTFLHPFLKYLPPLPSLLFPSLSPSFLVSSYPPLVPCCCFPLPFPSFLPSFSVSLPLLLLPLPLITVLDQIYSLLPPFPSHPPSIPLGHAASCSLSFF